jgi:anaerobic magnesium-protoporphyrin IX monomethyl ester cyclase
MKVCLIYPDVASIHGLPYHPGLASIASFLIALGHEVKVEYFNNPDDERTLIDRAAAFRPDIVGFTAVETQFYHVKRLAARLKKVLGVPMICGGSYVTLAPDVVMDSDSPFDAVVMGEGEHAMAEVLDKLRKGDAWLASNNIAYRDGRTDRLVRNQLNPLIDGLDLLPYPATWLFPYQEIIDHENVAMFHFNRGCAYQCRFCSNAALGRVYGMASNRLRFRSTGSVMNEIENVLLKYRLRDDTILCFADDLFIFDRKWIVDFCEQYKNKIGRPFWCTGRSNHITDEICKALKSAGCKMLMMSVESGNDYIRNEVMGRNISRETMFRSFELCHEYGINTLASCIIGLPFETPEMIEDSIDTISQLKSVTSYGVNIFYPYNGTYLRKVCEEKGLMPESMDINFTERRESILRLPGLPKEKLDYYYSNWTGLIMKRKGASERMKYAARRCWESLRKTAFGHRLRRIINDTYAGMVFKRIIMKYVWNKV